MDADGFQEQLLAALRIHKAAVGYEQDERDEQDEQDENDTGEKDARARLREIFSFITDDKTFCQICSALAIHIAPERRGLKNFVSNLPGALATVYLAQLLES
eukprot:SAG31_NODE_2719_length_5189_cov_4.394029_2_plen_102_part_00